MQGPPGGSGASVVKEIRGIHAGTLSRISAQKEEEVGAAEGSNDGFALKMNKTLAAHKDTVEHIHLNWPTDLQRASIMHTDSRILGL